MKNIILVVFLVLGLVGAARAELIGYGSGPGAWINNVQPFLLPVHFTYGAMADTVSQDISKEIAGPNLLDLDFYQNQATTVYHFTSGPGFDAMANDLVTQSGHYPIASWTWTNATDGNVVSGVGGTQNGGYNSFLSPLGGYAHFAGFTIEEIEFTLKYLHLSGPQGFTLPSYFIINYDVNIYGHPAGNNSTPVPEPSTILLLGSGLLGLVGFRRKIKK